MKKRRKIGGFIPHRLAIVIIIPLFVVVCVIWIIRDIAAPDVSEETMKRVEEFADKHDLKVGDWPDNIIAMMDKNPETEEFVLNYPLKKDKKFDITMNGHEECKEVPLIMQWDERWGYTEYSGEIMGLSGCGPTCLSMVSIYLTGNTEYNPRYIADMSEIEGYVSKGKGSSWTLISEGAEKLGIDVDELPLHEQTIINELEAGNPIICVMDKGDFTSTGHYIVMTGYSDGKIKINDPNSISRSNKLWKYDKIKDQIKNLWVCKAI